MLRSLILATENFSLHKPVMDERMSKHREKEHSMTSSRFAGTAFLSMKSWCLKPKAKQKPAALLSYSGCVSPNDQKTTSQYPRGKGCTLERSWGDPGNVSQQAYDR